MSTTSKSLYETLGLGKKASDKEIRKAYLRLSLKCHPDKQGGSDEAFIQLKDAYDALMDPVQRSEYDSKQERENSPGRKDPFPRNQQSSASSNGKPQQQPEAGRTTGDGIPKSPPKSQPSHSRSSNTGESRSSRTSQQSSGSSSKPRQRESGNSTAGGIPRPPPRAQSSHSHSSNTRRQKSSSSTGSSGAPRGTARKEPRSQPGPSAYAGRSRDYSSSPKTVFGTRKDGEPCMRCVRQGCFCYQHTEQAGTTQRTGKSNAGYSQKQQKQQGFSSGHHAKVFGVTLDGEPCKRCMQQGRFCHQHSGQAPASRRKSNTQKKTGHSKTGSRRVYGCRADGQPCLRCSQQQRFCFQHVHQQRSGKSG